MQGHDVNRQTGRACLPLLFLLLPLDTSRLAAAAVTSLDQQPGGRLLQVAAAQPLS